MANFGSYKENGVRSLDSAIDHAIAKRMNEANRVYENNVNEMFSKLHSQSDYNSSDYERIAFSNKEDASRFLQDMKDQGIDAVGSSRKVMGQILIEIPREINYSDLNADSELAKKMAGASMSSVSAADVIRDAGSRMDIGTEKPFKTEYLDEHGNESGDGDLYNYLTDEMDALGKVINNMVKIGTELEKYRPASGMAKSAVVINNETVVIDGKLVTDDATRESILKRHEERINTAEDILNKSSFDHETKIQPIVSNSEAIIKNIYKQDYAVTDNFKAESFYKDMAISKTQGDMMYSLYNTDPAKFTYKETQAINSFYNSGHVNNLDFSEREVLFKKLDKIKQDNDVQGFNKADWNEIKSQISLSDVEKSQRNEINSSGTTTCVRVDFALHELNDIASELNTDWHISNSPFTYKTSMLDVTKFGENGDALKNILKKSGELGLSREQIGVLDKLSNAKAAGLGEIKLNAMEKYHLSTAAEAYSLKFGKNLSAAEKTSLDSLLKSKLCTLNPSEYSALQNMISIQKDLGVNVTRANFNADKLLEINKAFIMRAQKEGIDIFSKKNGKWTIDPDKIGKLSSAQLKRFGISKHTQQFLMKLNRAQILREDLKDLKRIGLNLLLKADDSGTFAELHNAFTKAKKAYEYTMQSIIYLRQGVTYVKLRKGAKIKSSSKYGKGVLKPKTAKSKTPKKPKAKKPPKQVSSQKLAKHAAKAQKAQAKAVKKAARRQRSLLGRYRALKNKVLFKVAGTKLGGFLINFKNVLSAVGKKVVIATVAVMFMLTAAMVVCIAAVQCISSFLDLVGLSKPKTYQDTIGWKLYYEVLAPMEQEWVEEDVQDYNAISVDRVRNRYGADYQEFQDYISNFDDLVLLDKDKNGYYSDIAINPFYKDNKPETRSAQYYEKYSGTKITIPHSYNADVLTDSTHLITEKEKKKDENGEEKTVWHYDGEQITSFGANNNAFDKIDNKVIAPDGSVRSNQYGYSSIESGHTSNIKDIICMVDVMYGMDLDESIADLDKGEQSILGKTPAQLKWEDLADNTAGFFKWLWNTIKAPFTSAKYEPMRKFCQKHVGYSTVCKYASTLFSDSHQEEIAFEVKYYKNEPIMINTDTGIIDITSNIDQENASILGYCKNPVKNKFEIFWNKNADTPRISPFFWKNGDDATGIKFPVDTGKYEVTVTMDNLADKNEEVCLRENMSSDEDTFKFIESQTKNYHCWKQFKTDEVSDSKVVYANSTGGDGWYSGNVNDWDFNTDTLVYHEGSDGWYDSEEAAKANVEAALRAEYDNASLPETKYFLDSNRDLFRKTSYEKPEFKVDYSDATIETWEDPDRPLEGGVEEEHVHFDRFSNVLSTEGGTGWGYVLKIDGKGTDGTEYHAEKNVDTDSYDIIEDSEGYFIGPTLQLYINHPDGEREYWDTGLPSGSYLLKMEKMVRKVPKHKKMYRVLNAKVCLYEQKENAFKRDCSGHIFSYCGGHICVHSHGVTYSMTNEQIDMIDMQDDNSGKPLADNFDLKDNGYDEIRGKVITENVQYDNLKTIASSGGARSPLFDPQGSASGMQGLNVKVVGEEWKSGYDLRGSTAWHTLRDIFDVDCVILKGDNVFPTHDCNIREYEGWNSDNMTLALMKFCSDWHDTYGFDIPQELCHGSMGEKGETEVETLDGKKVTHKMIVPYEFGYKGAGQAPLSTADINKVVDALKTKYAGNFSSEREKAVRETLGFVGKGHFNDLHKHNFLDEPCQGLTVSMLDPDGIERTVTYAGCCTAGDEKAFVNYIRHHNGKTIIERGEDASKNYTFESSSNSSNALPGDTIVHLKTDDLNDVVLPSYCCLIQNFGTESERRFYANQIKENQREKFCVFIGILDEEIKLSTGQVIKPNVPVVVDLTAMNDKGIGSDYKSVDGLGNIYLHGIDEGNDFSGKSFAIYSWLINDTTRTRVIDLE